MFSTFERPRLKLIRFARARVATQDSCGGVEVEDDLVHYYTP